MQSQDRYRIALLSAYALALHGFESLIPMPIPWLRAGLSNIIALTTLVLFGFRAAMMVTLTRVMLASLLTGSFLGPSFILSLGGGVSSVAASGLVLRVLPNIFGTVGISLIGAFFHNISQLLIAYLLFIQKIEPVLIIAPFLILLGTVTGFVNGLVAGILVRNLKNSGSKIQNSNK
ncbi:MAG: Gx transporter family protein [Nitrospirota bacterium]|jgi:heptaprenyl diphosphate synthase